MEESDQSSNIKSEETEESPSIKSEDANGSDQSPEIKSEDTEESDKSLNKESDQSSDIKSDGTEESDKTEIKREPPDAKDKSSESGEKSSSSEASPEKQQAKVNYRLRNIFVRPRYAEPRHPVFSSLFARHISAMAFGPKKPKWYTPLTSAQLYLFKDIMNYVEIGRAGIFRFEDFMEALQDFESSISQEEVLDTLDSMEKNEFEELDFGKFLFLLAYRDHPPDMEDPDEIDKTLSAPIVTPRQCLILSAISYYVLIASPEEIERYYIGNTRRKSTVLHYHMEASRLLGLTEKQMEVKQKKAMRHLGPLFAISGSPYAYPVPFVPRFKKAKLFRELTKRRRSSPKSALPMEKKPIKRPITPIKQSRELGEKVAYKTKDDQTYYDMHYGRIPMPRMSIPEKMRKEMRKGCTVQHKDYITRKAYEAIKEYKSRLKEATALYNTRSLDTLLRKGFPTASEEAAFIGLFERYMPLKIEDVDSFSLWVRPAGYQLKHDGKPLYPDRFAFGSKIP